MRALVAVLFVTAVLMAGVKLASAAPIVITLRVESAEMAVGEVRPVRVNAEIARPGLGGWYIDITYDPDVVSVIDCMPADLPGEPNECDGSFAPNTIRIIGASASGVEGSVTFAVAAFECERAGVSPLVLAFEAFDATLADPPKTQAELIDGSITCVEPATLQPRPRATPPPALPSTGTGAGNGGGTAVPLPFALLGAAATALGLTLLRGASRLSKDILPTHPPREVV